VKRAIPQLAAVFIGFGATVLFAVMFRM